MLILLVFDLSGYNFKHKINNLNAALNNALIGILRCIERILQCF